MLRLFQQLGLVDKVQVKRFPARFVVGTAGDLDQATAAKLGAVTRLSVAQVSAAFVAGLGFGRAPDLFHVFELAGLMTDLGDEGRNPLRADDLITVHGSVKDRCKNAGNMAGVREDLQQLLRGDGHGFLRAKKYPHSAGFRIAAGLTLAPPANQWRLGTQSVQTHD